MKKLDIEVMVGLFIFVGLLFMAYISINLGRVDFFNTNYYPIQATFSSVKGLKVDTDIEIAGVKVGKVEDIQLKDYEAQVTLLLHKNIQVRDDAIASIRTKGLLGEKYVEISPGGSDVIIEPGGDLFDTEPSFDLESIIKKAILDKE